MDIISLIIVLVLVGILVWAANAYLPVAQPFKGIVIFLIILCGVLWVAQTFGVFSGSSLRVGSRHSAAEVVSLTSVV
jgi:hypothetical protein